MPAEDANACIKQTNRQFAQGTLQCDTGHCEPNTKC